MTEYDEEEVTSWAALADEFAHRAKTCRENFEEVKELEQTEAMSRTGRSAIGWLSLYEAYDNCVIRMRHLIPRLGDPHGPPKVGDLIAGNKVDRCAVGTLLRGDHYGAAAIRTVSGWQVTGMSAAQGVIFVTHNMWKVVEVPEPGRKTS